MSWDVYMWNAEAVKKCFICDYELLDNLNISYSNTNSMIVLWNKYQIFVYENMNFNYPSCVFDPDFLIMRLRVTYNYLVCLDYSGNLHTTALKFKHTQKRIKTGFLPKDNNIQIFELLNSEQVVSIKYFKDVFLRYYTVTSEFRCNKTIKLNFHNLLWNQQILNIGKQLIRCCETNKEILEKLTQTFHFTHSNEDKHYLIIYSSDKINLYGFIVTTSNTEVNTIKLYSCVSEICDIELLENGLSVLVVMESGTVIKLPLCEYPRLPKITHLNTAISNFCSDDNNLIYTDGLTMWKADNIFETNVKYYLMYVKLAKDVIKLGSQVIVTSYSKMIYCFDIADKTCYLEPEPTKYYSAKTSLNSSAEYLHEIVKEIDNNEEIVKKIHEESSFIKTLALGNRPELLENVIKHKCIVYESYEEAIKDKTEIILTNNLCDYFTNNKWYILCNITTTDAINIFNQIINRTKTKLQLHITIATQKKNLYTISIKIKELSKVNLLIPIPYDHIHGSLNLELKIVTNIPEAYNKNKEIWIVLYQSYETVTSEQFIKSNFNNNSSINIRNTQDSKNSAMYDLINCQYGNLFQFSERNIYNRAPSRNVYVKLPTNFTEIFKCKEKYSKIFCKSKAESLLQQLSSREFLTSRSPVYLYINGIKVAVSILDEFSKLLLKISSESVEISHNIRLFFSRIIYENYKNDEPTTYFVPSAFYTSVQNLHREIEKFISEETSVEEFLVLADQFERCVIGSLPL